MVILMKYQSIDSKLFELKYVAIFNYMRKFFKVKNLCEHDGIIVLNVYFESPDREHEKNFQMIIDNIEKSSKWRPKLQQIRSDFFQTSWGNGLEISKYLWKNEWLDIKDETHYLFNHGYIGFINLLNNYCIIVGEPYYTIDCYCWTRVRGESYHSQDCRHWKNWNEKFK